MRNFPIIDPVKTGCNIRRIMQLRGITVKDVQTFLELSTVQSVYHWLNGKSLPSIDNIYALSELLEIQIDDLLIGNRKHSG